MSLRSFLSLGLWFGAKMTQVVKTALTTATAVAGGRLAAGARNVAVVDPTAVEETNPGVGASFNDASFLSHDFAHRHSNEGNQHPGGQDGGGFNTPSRDFAAMIAFQENAGDPGQRGVVTRSRGFAGLVAKAIHIYETNAKVISGNHNVLGTSLSITL